MSASQNRFRRRMGPAAEIEALEARRLLSAKVQDGVLFVVGTDGPERIKVWEYPKGTLEYVVVILPIPSAGTSEHYIIPGDGVRLVSVRALGGNDVVDVYSSPLDPESWPLHLPTRVDGGTGNDSVYGSRARSFILGGFGNDTILGGAAGDWINGGWGDDTISGNDGNDVIFGDRGNDALRGNRGNDRLYGGPGNDELGYYDKVGGPENHEPGDDLLDGGSGDDVLIGGAGTDRMFGGAGFDRFFYLDTPQEIIDWSPGEPTDYRPPIR